MGNSTNQLSFQFVFAANQRICCCILPLPKLEPDTLSSMLCGSADTISQLEPFKRPCKQPGSHIPSGERDDRYTNGFPLILKDIVTIPTTHNQKYARKSKIMTLGWRHTSSMILVQLTSRYIICESSE